MKRKRTIDCFCENLAAFSYNHDLTIPKMCELLNVSPSTVSMWKRKKAFPRIEVLEKLADYFGISVAELLTDYEQDNSNTISLNKNEFTEDELKAILNYIEYVKIRHIIDDPNWNGRVILRDGAALIEESDTATDNKRYEIIRINDTQPPAAESSAPSDQDE